MQLYPMIVGALVALVLSGAQAGVIEPRARIIDTKVFNYQGPMLIKDDRTNEIIKADEDDPIPIIDTSSNQTVDEAACWKLIVEQSAVTFELQNRVIDELEADMKDLQMDENLKDIITRLISRIRSSMHNCLEALKTESPEEYFDSLFETSDSIVRFSSLVRDSKLDETVFLVLIKAVSRLGRNNSALVQEFVDNCTIVDHTQPRPRLISN